MVVAAAPVPLLSARLELARASKPTLASSLSRQARTGSPRLPTEPALLYSIPAARVILKVSPERQRARAVAARVGGPINQAGQAKLSLAEPS